MIVLTSTFQPLEGSGNPDGYCEILNTLVKGQVHIDPIQLLRSFLESQDQGSEAKLKHAREGAWEFSAGQGGPPPEGRGLAWRWKAGG